MVLHPSKESPRCTDAEVVGGVEADSADALLIARREEEVSADVFIERLPLQLHHPPSPLLHHLPHPLDEGTSHQRCGVEEGMGVKGAEGGHRVDECQVVGELTEEDGGGVVA